MIWLDILLKIHRRINSLGKQVFPDLWLKETEVLRVIVDTTFSDVQGGVPFAGYFYVSGNTVRNSEYWT